MSDNTIQPDVGKQVLDTLITIQDVLEDPGPEYLNEQTIERVQSMTAESCSPIDDVDAETVNVTVDKLAELIDESSVEDEHEEDTELPVGGPSGEIHFGFSLDVVRLEAKFEDGVLPAFRSWTVEVIDAETGTVIGSEEYECADGFTITDIKGIAGGDFSVTKTEYKQSKTAVYVAEKHEYS